MSDEIKKIKIKDLPPATSINDNDIFVESDTLETYKVTADDIAEYVSENEHLTEKYVLLNSKGVANGVTPLNSNKKIDGNYIIYGNTANTAYEGSAGKILEQNLDNHLVDDDAHGYNTKINAEIVRATNAESNLDSNKVDKISGKGLSTNDYTTTEKNKLDGIASGAEVNVQSDWDVTDSSSDAYIKNKPSVYTKNEVDNKFSALETNVDWKEAVNTYNDIATTYPIPQDGWTVNVKDTDYTYRYNGTSWVAISANAIPKATNSVDGLLSKEDHINYEDTNSKKHTHDNKSVIDGITSAFVSDWNSAKTHADSTHAPSNAEVNQNAFSNVKVDSTIITANSKTDTVTLVAGDNITFTPDSVNNKITVSSTGGNVNPGDSVSFTQSLETGTKIGTITINGLDTDLYCQTNTDTTYSVVTTSDNGLMSTSDKIKLDYTNIAYCTCNTAAGTAAKVATIDGNSKFVLQKGAIAIVKFTVTNTASSCTLNVGNTGAKSIWYNNAAYTGNNNNICGYKNRFVGYIYDGTYWVWIFSGVDMNSTYSNASLGQGYGTCTTAAATVAKVVTLSSYALVINGIVAVKFTYAVPASATMNINNKGAKAIYYKGKAITSGIINAGDIATFIYNGSQYVLIGIDTCISGSNGSNEVVSATEPTNQSVGDYWLKEY